MWIVSLMQTGRRRLSSTCLSSYFQEIVPRQWREDSNIFKKGDREDPGNYRGITLLSGVRSVL